MLWAWSWLFYSSWNSVPCPTSKHSQTLPYLKNTVVCLHQVFWRRGTRTEFSTKPHSIFSVIFCSRHKWTYLNRHKVSERNGKSDIDMQSRGYENLVDEIKAVGGKPRGLLKWLQRATTLSERSAEDIPVVSLKKPKLLSQTDSDVLNLFFCGMLPLFGPLTNIHLRVMLSKPFQCGRTELYI